MNHFAGLRTDDEIKTKYRDLAKQYHPDIGGDVEVMKAINNQYEEALTTHFRNEGKSSVEIHELLKNCVEIMNKLCEIVGVPGISIEVCGSWLWITGNTKEVKETLKNNGFMWSAKKSAWYWRKVEERRKRYHGGLSLEEIRVRYGSRIFEGLEKRGVLA